MIFKIHQSDSDVNAAIRYNENKMDGQEGLRPDGGAETEGIENGHILVTRNLREGASLAEEFERRKLESIKQRRNGKQTTNISFHMSVNPSETDRPLGEKEAAGLIDEVMKELGYGAQPYRIYQHTDIERKHYHVVSCRLDENGKKINDSFEILRLRRILLSLQEKYGFSIVLNDMEKDEQRTSEKERQDLSGETQDAPRRQSVKEKEKPARKEKKTVYPFSRRSEEPVTEQMKTIIEDSMNWYFSTFEQYQALLLRRYQLLLLLQSENNKLVVSGTDKNGNKITPPINEDILGTDLINRINEKISRERMRSRTEQRKRIEKLADASAGLAKTYDDFRRLMEGKGVYVVVSWNENNEAFGLTYIDRATRCIFKGSETSVSLAWLKDKCKEKGWTITKDILQKQIETSNRSSSKRNISQAEKTAGGEPAEKETRTRSRGAGRKPGRWKDEYIGRVGHQEGSTKQAGDGGEDDIWNNGEDDRPVELIR